VSRPKKLLSVVKIGGKAVVLTRQDKLSIERAYGHSVPKEAWLEIAQATAVFSFFCKAGGQPTIGPFLKKLAKLRIAAEAVRTELGRDHMEFSASVGDVCRRYFQSEMGQEHQLLDVLGHTLDATVDISSLAADRLKNPKYPFDEGLDAADEMWKLWICNLTWILDDAGLPTGVRKDGGTKNGRYSPFVHFAFEIQKFMPAHLTKSMPSEHSADEHVYLDSLAQAIYRARHGTHRGEFLHHGLLKLLNAATG
jgi:hypothetical protein